jgi:outer membrane immunogenic protein
MKRLFVGMLASAALVAAAGGVSAADLPVKTPSIPVPICGAGIFHGFYVGGQVGTVGYRADRLDQDAYLGEVASYSATKDRWGGGAQVGYNYQCGNKLWGFEADWMWTSTTATSRLLPNAPVDLQIISRLQSFGTLRTRTGIIVDNVLLYITGGFAAARINTAWHNVNPAVPIAEELAFNDTRWGWTIGAGAEVALWDRWSIKSEALYIRLTEKSYSAVSPTLGPPPFGFTHNDDIWTARVGLNYHFGWDPVVPARY